MTPRIAEAAQSDPFTFNIKEPRLRIFKRKSLLDNTKVLSMHMTLDISLIRQELSRFQIQTINHMLASTSKMMSQTRGMKFNRLPDVEGADNTSMADHGFHIKIKKLELWLKNHRNARVTATSTSFWGHFSRLSQLYATPHAPYDVIYLVPLLGC